MIIKNYFFFVFCLILFSLTACKKEPLEDPFVQHGGSNQVWWPNQNGVNPEEDLRSDYQAAIKTISVDIGQVKAHIKMLEEMREYIESISYTKAELTEVRLSNLVLVPSPFQETTWETYLKDLNLLFIPDRGAAPTILANFSHLGPIGIQTDFGFVMDIIDQNLVDLFFNKPGRFSLEFSFTDLPDDKISLVTTQFYFTSKYQITR